MDADLLAWLCDGPAPRPPPRLLLVAAHPDDEVIGASRVLARLTAHVQVLHVTDGVSLAERGADPEGAEAYAAQRRAEAEAGLRLAGVDADHVLRLDVPDQQAAHCLVELSRRVSQLLQIHRVDAVLTHPYEGGHPDHDAVAFAIHAAARLFVQDGRAPALLEFASYHERAGRMFTGGFVDPQGADHRRVFVLSPSERSLKQRMLACHASQAEVVRWFQTETELLRPAPEYDFTAPAHTALYYERFAWGMTGALWSRLAAQALSALGLA